MSSITELSRPTTELSGSTALVTGATAGIGRAVALRLADAGVRVVVHGRDAQRGAEVVDEIAARGGSARFVAADLADEAETLRLVEEAGEVDILVNNAGYYDFTPGPGVESFDKHFAINTRAPFLLVTGLAPGMRKRGRGNIVNVTTTAVTSPPPFGGVYGASKAAVEVLTRSWATELGPQGIRVNAVSPGPVRTRGTTALAASMDIDVDLMGQASVHGQLGEPEEIAETILFLIQPRSSYVNGSVLLAHGGGSRQ
jgi:NAD(P)-dependent dehydrogenase (short-subunit alcohol dehydrogenase family)